jgi:hypothetical protein
MTEIDPAIARSLIIGPGYPLRGFWDDQRVRCLLVNNAAGHPN